jgi:hypothetical protein
MDVDARRKIDKLESEIKFLKRLIHAHLNLDEMSLEEAWTTGTIVCHDVNDYQKEECICKNQQCKH